MSGAELAQAPAIAPKVSTGVTAPRILQRKCACGGGASTLSGDCDACKAKRLQRRLAVGASHDPFEVEADRVADQVTARRVPRAVEAAPVRVQRMSGSAMGGAASAAPPSAAPPSVERVLASPGRALEPEVRRDMERRFGHDFSAVRVHHGATAEASARDVNARAYTVGRDIVFGAGSYSPRTDSGRRLLAHELAHTMQQGAHGHRLQRSPAGSCATSWADANTAGEAAHLQIQKFFALDPEEELPRATKDDKSKSCPKRGRPAGKVDLLRTDQGTKAQIGEIKASNDGSIKLGEKEVEHYVRRYRQLGERLNGGECYDPVGDRKDQEFVSKWFPNRLQRNLQMPKGAALSGVIPTFAKKPLGRFDYDPRKFLWCELLPKGVVKYWCTRTNRRKNDKDKDDRLFRVLTVTGVGVTAVATKKALDRSKAVAEKAAERPATKHATKPSTATSKQATQPRPHRSPKARNGTPRPHSPARLNRTSARPRGPAPRGGGGGGFRGFSRVAGPLALLAVLWDAKEAIAAGRAQAQETLGPLKGWWAAIEKELNAAKAKATTSSDDTAIQPAPPPRPALAPTLEPQEPPEKEVTIRLYDATPNRFTERKVSVPRSAVDMLYFPVEFFSLTRPGEPTTSFKASQIDCLRLHKGLAGVSGYRLYQGYARAGDAQQLNAILRMQLTVAQVLHCLPRIARLQPQTQPDGDMLTAKLSSAEGDTVEASCTTLVGAQGPTCKSEGNFEAMKALMDDPALDFILEVTFVRTRDGKEQTPSHGSVSVRTDGNNEPDVIIEGGIPADMTGQGYPTGDLAYLLDIYLTWSRGQ